MRDALNAAKSGAGALSSQDRADRERLERFLPQHECLTWAGAPQLSRLFLRAMSRTALMALIASVGIYFALNGITPDGFCGTEPSRGCRKLYIWPWFGLVIAATYTPLLWLSFLAHSSGLLREFYGLTDMQALKFRANPFDRFQSVRLSQLTDQQIGTRKRLGTVVFGSVAFLCLSDKDAEAVLQTSGKARRIKQPPHARTANNGPTT